MAERFVQSKEKNKKNYHRYFSASIRERLHETRSELRPVWNLKPLWDVILFTWQFTWRFHCGNFKNNSKALLHMCKWYFLINVNLIKAKKKTWQVLKICYFDLYKSFLSLTLRNVFLYSGKIWMAVWVQFSKFCISV